MSKESDDLYVYQFIYLYIYIYDGNKKVTESKAGRINWEVKESHNNEITSVLYILSTQWHQQYLPSLSFIRYFIY